jgi:hypothetical protein
MYYLNAIHVRPWKEFFYRWFFITHIKSMRQEAKATVSMLGNVAVNVQAWSIAP